LLLFGGLKLGGLAKVAVQDDKLVVGATATDPALPN